MATNNYTRAKDVVHYICAQCRDSRKFGAVKLNKILWYADTLFYARGGQSLTGLRYIKMRLGPVPSDIQHILDQMEQKDKTITVTKSDPSLPSGKYNAWVFQANGEPDMSHFSTEEKEVLDNVISHIRDHHTSDSISELSHNWAWEIAQMGEEIPVGTCLITDFIMPNEADKKWASDLLAKHESRQG